MSVHLFSKNSVENILREHLAVEVMVNKLVSQLQLHSEFSSYLPTPPLGQDMTQGQFLSGV